MKNPYLTLCGQTIQTTTFDEVMVHEHDCADCAKVGRRKNVPFMALNIVNQVLDLSEASVEQRQKINDVCDQFVTRLLEDHEKFVRLQLADQFAQMCQHDGVKHYQCSTLVAAHDAYLIIRQEDLNSGSAHDL